MSELVRQTVVHHEEAPEFTRQKPPKLKAATYIYNPIIVDNAVLNYLLKFFL